ncbi:hypothetical protein U1Q18_001536, partial [Sarracenia purpurea var. burkii]
MLSATRAVSSKCSPCPSFCSKTHMDSPPTTLCPRSFSRSSSSSPSPPGEVHGEVNGGDAAVSLQEWRAWGTASPVPAMVAEIVEDLKALERHMDAQMSFGGLGGKLKGDFKVHEDKKHRAKYQALGDSEKKLQFFAARQIACRLLGSRDYLCQKDFLRQNNTGKLLWQVFGVQAASLCLFGISEHEQIMWDAFKLAGTQQKCALLDGHEWDRLIHRFGIWVMDYQSIALSLYLNTPFQTVGCYPSSASSSGIGSLSGGHSLSLFLSRGDFQKRIVTSRNLDRGKGRTER